ncbi:UNVERIFIED_CONTAM: hypothetical protein K2H54_045440 [Gekko kuhli]
MPHSPPMLRRLANRSSKSSFSTKDCKANEGGRETKTAHRLHSPSGSSVQAEILKLILQCQISRKLTMPDP